MPFTFSHPAIVLPFAYLPKRYYSLTGLIVGSMSPDFEYFIRIRVTSSYSHTFVGLFIFDVPITIIVAFLFHNYIKSRLFDNLPNYLSSRFAQFKDFNWNNYAKQNWGVVLFSSLVGAISHILWDGFTHKNGCFVTQLPFLSNTIEVLGKNIFYYKILQHSSTLVGAVAIFAVISQLVSIEKIKNVNWKYWLIVIFISIVIILLRIIIGDIRITQIGNIIVTAISSVFVAVVLTPIVLSATNKKTQND